MKLTATLLFVFSFLVSAFTSEPDIDTIFQNGEKNLQNKEYLKAISDFTLVISLQPDFGKAYLQRAKAKIEFTEKMGVKGSEYCLDLVQALQLGQYEATQLLQRSCLTECYGPTTAFVEPDMVFCADFSSKILTDLPQGSEKMRNLFKLNLFNNKLTRVSTGFSNFPALLMLDLSSNHIQLIDPSIGRLKNLGELNLSKNELTSLPEEIGQLAKMHTLYLRSNQLSSLPEALGKCQNLEYLDLSFNKLKFFPEELYVLKKLKTLNLSGNFLDKKTQKIISESLPKTQVFF